MAPTSPKNKPSETDQSSIKKKDDRPVNISKDKAKQLAEQMNQKAEELFSFIDAQLQNVVWLQLGEAPNDDFSFSSMEGDNEEDDNNDDASSRAEGSNTAASSSAEGSNNKEGGNKDASSDEEDNKEDASSGEGDSDDATFSDEENSDDAWFGDLRKRDNTVSWEVGTGGRGGIQPSKEMRAISLSEEKGICRREDGR
ncbi:hypothetical protein CGLO_15031 [Colletotrichum gloeosporioides Cg-14]|uniref:Uncharacterized protein n=1 Tax=Colletotrichum gloeosporioides (strain Cg-14) TaxID=1237896 RepID=T0K2R3_COLGC|nr:hypothetical protein CGLO_15031 [Colletotrichum gloeosporioides Cg-14]